MTSRDLSPRALRCAASLLPLSRLVNCQFKNRMASNCCSRLLSIASRCARKQRVGIYWSETDRALRLEPVINEKEGCPVAGVLPCRILQNGELGKLQRPRF